MAEARSRSAGGSTTRACAGRRMAAPAVHSAGRATARLRDAEHGSCHGSLPAAQSTKTPRGTLAFDLAAKLLAEITAVKPSRRDRMQGRHRAEDPQPMKSAMLMRRLRS